MPCGFFCYCSDTAVFSLHPSRQKKVQKEFEKQERIRQREEEAKAVAPFVAAMTEHRFVPLNSSNDSLLLCEVWKLSEGVVF